MLRHPDRFTPVGGLTDNHETSSLQQPFRHLTKDGVVIGEQYPMWHGKAFARSNPGR
ncbi:MAG: hypothetical protein ACFE9C_17405 [Candidatus Hodarchaeota archaeon]